MKICICGDVHWSKYSSILRGRGDKYSTRLEGLIDTINWVESIGEHCDKIVYLGDFFDTTMLDAEELTALGDVKWSHTYKHFIVGNHEMATNDLSINTTNVFSTIGNCEINDKPTTLCIGDIEICLLPYILEDNRLELCEYFGNTNKKRLICSHNDIKGIQMGKFLSQDGFSIDDIENSCDLFVNGHLHNGCKVTDKIINLGNITGQNFSEDAFKYSHNLMILDTDNLSYELIENPYAFNFYKCDNSNIDKVSNNAIISYTCTMQNEIDTSTIPNIKVIRTTYSNNSKIEEVHTIEELSVDHIEQFREFIFNKLGKNDLVCNEIERLIIND